MWTLQRQDMALERSTVKGEVIDIDEERSILTMAG